MRTLAAIAGYGSRSRGVIYHVRLELEGRRFALFIAEGWSRAGLQWLGGFHPLIGARERDKRGDFGEFAAQHGGAGEAALTPSTAFRWMAGDRCSAVA
jgi:hypothetical protein